MNEKKIQVGILMGSQSDWPIMKQAGEILEQLGISYEAKVLSAHRTPQEVQSYAEKAFSRGIRVLIAGAGGAAHLPGFLAAFTEIPIIGVPIGNGPLKGQDSLLSIVQMPRGIPVASVAIDNATNAALLAAQILAYGGQTGNTSLQEKLHQERVKMREKVLTVTLND